MISTTRLRRVAMVRRGTCCGVVVRLKEVVAVKQAPIVLGGTTKLRGLCVVRAASFFQPAH